MVLTCSLLCHYLPRYWKPNEVSLPVHFIGDQLNTKSQGQVTKVAEQGAWQIWVDEAFYVLKYFF